MEKGNNMDTKEWLDAVEECMCRKARTYEQRFIARQYDVENTDETAVIIVRLILENDTTPAKTL